MTEIQIRPAEYRMRDCGVRGELVRPALMAEAEDGNRARNHEYREAVRLERASRPKVKRTGSRKEPLSPKMTPAEKADRMRLYRPPAIGGYVLESTQSGEMARRGRQAARRAT